MDLILWRHAEAEDGFPDLERQLTRHGEAQARAMAAWLRKRLPESTRVISSPAERCQRTARTLRQDIEIIDQIAPGASHRELLAAAGWPNADDTVVLVNHQPTVGELAAYLLSGEAAPWRVKKGAIWWMHLRHGHDHSRATLKAMVTPDML